MGYPWSRASHHGGKGRSGVDYWEGVGYNLPLSQDQKQRSNHYAILIQCLLSSGGSYPLWRLRPRHPVVPASRENSRKVNLSWWSVATEWTHPAAFKHKGLVISPQFNVRTTAWPGPANTHVSSSYNFKFKVPLSRLYGIWPFYPEKSNLVYADLLNSRVSYCEKQKKGRREREVTDF